MKNNFDIFDKKDVKIVDKETGRIFNFEELENKVQVKVVEGKKIKRNLSIKQVEYLNVQARRRGNKDLFIWSFFTYNEPYLPNVKDALISRIIYFATFCNEDGYVICNNSIGDILGTNSNQTQEFSRELESNKILKIKDKRAYISNNFFAIGELEKVNSDYIRIFVNSSRDLYDSNKLTAHKHLSYIYRMIPYLNRQTNILSKNQKEQDIERFEYMTLKEFCAKVGYDMTHSSRLRMELSKFRICGELVVGFFDEITRLTPKGKYVVVNPRLLYGGEINGKNYRKITKLFEKERSDNFFNKIDQQNI